MNIKGRGNKAIDTDLLGQLAMKQQSGNTISQKEVKQVLSKVKSELKDEFTHSTRGLTRAGRAIENTFKLALESGWIKGEKAAQMIEDFVQTDNDTGLDTLMDDIRKNKQRRPTRTTYGGYRVSTPRPRPTVRRRTVGT